MKRRDFLRQGLIAAAGVALSNAAAGMVEAASGLTGQVFWRGQPGYEDARQGFNRRISHFPLAVVFCRSREDVARAIRWAKGHRVPLRPRCGRHCYEGFSGVDNGIVVDVSPMRHIHINRRQQIVHVGAGVKLLEFYEALWEHRMTVPAGSCATVGLAGLTLGGGYGLLARALGLTCDSLLAVELVTASGKWVRADARNHPDLFWACRGGGGGNFGVVTAFTFKTHPINKVAIYTIAWDFDNLETVLKAWQEWAPAADPRLTSILKLRAQSFGTISSVGQFVGSADELKVLLKPLSEVGTPREVSVEEVNYRDAVHIFAGLKPDYARWRVDWHKENTQFKNSSDYAAHPFGQEALNTIRHFLETAPSDADLLQMEAYGGAVSRIAPTATAFPHRAASLISLQYQAYWNVSENGAASMSWVTDFRDAMRPFVSGGAYSNYCDRDIADWPHAYYGANLDRLKKIKKEYDPHNFFQFPQGISPDGASAEPPRA